MKRLMIGIMMVVFAFSFVGGASALFSDSEFGGAVSNAGSLEILLGQDDLPNVELRPGMPAQYMIEIKNLGTIPLEYEVYASVEGSLAGIVTVDEVPGGTIGKGNFKKVFVTFTLPAGIDSAYKGSTGELRISVEAEQTGAAVGFTDSAVASVPLVVASPLPTVKIVSS